MTREAAAQLLDVGANHAHGHTVDVDVDRRLVRQGDLGAFALAPQAGQIGGATAHAGRSRARCAGRGAGVVDRVTGATAVDPDRTTAPEPVSPVDADAGLHTGPPTCRIATRSSGSRSAHSGIVATAAAARDTHRTYVAAGSSSTRCRSTAARPRATCRPDARASGGPGPTARCAATARRPAARRPQHRERPTLATTIRHRVVHPRQTFGQNIDVAGIGRAPRPRTTRPPGSPARRRELAGLRPVDQVRSRRSFRRRSVDTQRFVSPSSTTTSVVIALATGAASTTDPRLMTCRPPAGGVQDGPSRLTKLTPTCSSTFATAPLRMLPPSTAVRHQP